MRLFHITTRSAIRTAALLATGAALFASAHGDGASVAYAWPPPVAKVFVTETTGRVESVVASGVGIGTRTIIGSTGQSQLGPDSLLFEPSGKLLVTGLASTNVYRIDPTAPGGLGNVGTVVNTSALSGPESLDAAIDATGTTVLITNGTKWIDAVNLTTGAVTPHVLSGGMAAINGIAFDNAGQLWVADRTGNTVGLADLSANTYTPLCTSVGSGDGPDALSFDPTTGRLYASIQAANAIVRLNIGVGTCAAGPTFALTNFLLPDGIAADGQGGVFVAGTTGTLIRLDTTTSAETVIATGIAKLDDIAPVVGRGAPRSVGGLAGLPPAVHAGPPGHTTAVAAIVLALSALIALAARSWRVRRNTA